MKKNILNFVYICLFSLLFVGCASTDIVGVVKPNIELSKYNNVLVYSNIENYKYKKQLETEFQKQFSKNNIRSYKSIDLFSPLENYTESDFQSILTEKNIEIMLAVKILSTNAQNGDSSSFMMPVGGFFFGGGSTEIKLTMDFDVSIYDIKSNEIIFKGTATSEEEDDEFSDCIENIFESFAKKMVETYFLEKNE